MRFDWDSAKADSNRRKHRFTFEDAIAIFLDADRVIIDVSRAENGESRRKVIGRSGDRFFLIPARRSNMSEERSYGAHNARSG